MDVRRFNRLFVTVNRGAARVGFPSLDPGYLLTKRES